MSWRSLGRLGGYGAVLVAATTPFLIRPSAVPVPDEGLTGTSAPSPQTPQTNESNKTERRRSDVVSFEQRLADSISKGREACQKVKDRQALPGLAIAVSVNGQVVWVEGMGYSDLENGVEMSGDSVMRIASISKSMTMAMLAQLMEQGKIDIDDPIQKHLPAFPIKSVDGEKVSISTRHLLSHLSGIRHYTKKSEVQKEKKEEPPSDADLKEFFMKQGCPDLEKAMELFKNDDLFHKPGTKYLYTTHGWTVVSAIIEKLTETPFPKYAKRMFDFWGLRNTYLDEHEPIIYNRARYYSKDKDGRLVNSPYVDNSCKWAGGGFLSNVTDLLRFAHVLLYSKQYTPSANDAGDGVDRKPFLKGETMSEVWKGNEVTRDKKNDGDVLYALGFTVIDPFRKCMFCKERGLSRVGHSGGAVGASSTLVITFDPKHKCDSEGVGPKGVVVAMITNLIDVGLTSTATDIADLFAWML